MARTKRSERGRQRGAGANQTLASPSRKGREMFSSTPAESVSQSVARRRSADPLLIEYQSSVQCNCTARRGAVQLQNRGCYPSSFFLLLVIIQSFVSVAPLGRKLQIKRPQLLDRFVNVRVKRPQFLNRFLMRDGP